MKYTSKPFTSCQSLHKGLLLWSETGTGDDLLPYLCQFIFMNQCWLFIWSFCTNSIILRTCNEPFITCAWHMHEGLLPCKIWYMWWSVIWSVPRHFLNQCELTVHWIFIEHSQATSHYSEVHVISHLSPGCDIANVFHKKLVPFEVLFKDGQHWYL